MAGEMLKVIQELFICLKIARGVVLGFIVDVGSDGWDVEEGSVVARLRARFLKQRSSMHWLEWPR
jgi:hypothetical protein